MYQVDNAVIMAAGVSSRFAPLSYEKPKALTEVKGEVLIERQIRQLQAAGVPEIYLVVGYKAEQFAYLQEKLNVLLIMNEEYESRNNHSSIHAARHILRNSYICSADNYFAENPFEREVKQSYYAALFAPGDTREWCMQEDSEGYISHVEVGGSNAWYMLGHAFWSEDFTARFLPLLEAVYPLPQTKDLFWEDIFAGNLDVLKMQMRKYPDDYIFEFDSLDELREFDESYITDTRSRILKGIARELGGTEAEISRIEPIKTSSTAVAGIRFCYRGGRYAYTYEEQMLRSVEE